MFTLSDQSQLQASAIKKGNFQLTGTHQEIIEWITKQFGVKALDFSFERREASSASQQLIHIIVETAEDVQHMQANREHTNVIIERFRKYLQSPEASNHPHDPLKRTIFPNDTQPPIIVTWRPLKEVKPDIQKEIIEAAKRDILAQFENVWTISSYIVFYHTDAQVNENHDNGLSAKIIAALEKIDKKYDFKPVAAYRFDSKETFDRDYSSNWYYYWK